MDIVERLRGHAKGNAGGVRELLVLSADEIERLRQRNVELNQKIEDLVESLGWIANRLESNHIVPSEAILARNAIAKATGGE